MLRRRAFEFDTRAAAPQVGDRAMQEPGGSDVEVAGSREVDHDGRRRALAKRAKHGVERGRVGHAAVARDSQAVTRVAESGLEPHRMRPGLRNGCGHAGPAAQGNDTEC